MKIHLPNLSPDTYLSTAGTGVYVVEDSGEDNVQQVVLLNEMADMAFFLVEGGVDVLFHRQVTESGNRYRILMKVSEVIVK